MMNIRIEHNTIKTFTVIIFLNANYFGLHFFCEIFKAMRKLNKKLAVTTKNKINYEEITNCKTIQF